ncbi:hypothetical protein Taro_030222 [Colocasia esculenta]|uniref:Uncharacterized protein n=1 Tax=Colocasia esculenta TaxID=4460 RepID=A0A843VVK0_COLES|nr:hypothetical protein [Colocasia esculenta]
MRVGGPRADVGARLAPVTEEPVAEEDSGQGAGRGRSLRQLIRWRLPLLFQRRNQEHDLRVLLSVLGCPLSPVSAAPLSCQARPDNVSSKAEYIIRQFRATTGSGKMVGAAARSIYASGKLKMATVADAHGSKASAVAGGGHPFYEGCFVLWQMSGMWLSELMVAGRKVAAGSDGAVAWRRTPWLRTHAARGGARPLRRFLQASPPIYKTSSSLASSPPPPRTVF